MGKENPNISSWPEKTREAENAWIEDNMDVLSKYASEQYEENGRGAVYIDTAHYDKEMGHPFSFMPLGILEEDGREEVVAQVREYDPFQDFILILMKETPHFSLHQISNSSK